MSAIQKRVLGHINILLESVDTYETWKEMRDALAATSLDADLQKQILMKLDKAQKANVETHLTDAKGWLAVLQEDIVNDKK